MQKKNVLKLILVYFKAERGVFVLEKIVERG